MRIRVGAVIVTSMWTALTLGACRGEQPREPEPVQPAGAASPVTAPARQGAYGVCVTNEPSGDLTVVDPSTNTAVATVPLGKRPRGIRASPTGAQLYIALSGSISPPGVDESTLPPPDRSADGIGVVDVKTLRVVTVLRGPSDPEQTSVSGDGTRLYIANEDTGKASVLDIATGTTVAEFVVGGEPEGVTTSTDGRFVYVTPEEDDTISDHRPRWYRPWGIAISPDGRWLYTANGPSNDVSVIDAGSLTVVTRVPAGRSPWGIAIVPR